MEEFVSELMRTEQNGTKPDLELRMKKEGIVDDDFGCN